MNKELTLEERRQVQLKMLDEVDTFCRTNNIRYSLAFGTLLGAIRHKGFIPWDDDVDIMMPIDDLSRFKETFHSELVSYYDVFNCSKHTYPFSRLGHNGTYRKVGKVATNYGICIDLYIMVNIRDNQAEVDRFFIKCERWQRVRRLMNGVEVRVLKYLPIDIKLPLNNWINRRLTMCLCEAGRYGSTNTYYVIAGLIELRNTMIYDRDLFSRIIEVEFEGRKYLSVADWNYFLSLRYGDYMKLPPIEQRVPYHGGNYYWK